MLRQRHHWRSKDVRRQLTDPTGRWLPITAGEMELPKDRGDPGHPVSLPRHQDPRPLGQYHSLTTETVESPLRREAHGGFGERAGETDREQFRYRAPGLLSDRRTTATVELPVERTREDDLDRTCPAKVMAAIGGRDTGGQSHR
jgi:hypothetical protein